MEVDAVPTKLGEIPGHATERGLKFHPHWHHSIACDYAGIPDLAPPVGVFVPVRIDHEILAHDLTDLRRTGEVLIPVRGQHFPLNIGKAEIIKPAAVKDGNCHGASAALSELALHDEIRGKLVDGAADLLLRNK
jgi:hypothetical protein